MCQGPDENEGQEKESAWEQVSPVLLRGSLGGDTPVNLSGRGCHCSDVSVCVSVSVSERDQSEKRDRVGATG